MIGATRLLRAAVLSAVGLHFAGCTAFHPEDAAKAMGGTESRPSVASGETALSLDNLEKKQVVSLRGRFAEGVFRASKIQIQKKDEDVEIKGSLDSLDGHGNGRVAGIEFRRDERSKLVDEKGKTLEPGDFKRGDWVKVEAHEREGVLVLRKITKRGRKEGEGESLQGPIGEIQHRKNRLVIPPGIIVQFDPTVLVVWDAKEPPPALKGRQSGILSTRRFQNGVWTIKRREEDLRPEAQHTIGDLLFLGGEVKAELEWRGNHDLDDQSDRDRLVQDLSAKLEVTADISRHLMAFGKYDLGLGEAYFDQNSDLSEGRDFEIEETWLLIQDLPVRGLAFQLGRQRFVHGREWVMDDNLDGARLYANLSQSAIFELSISQRLFDTAPETDDVVNVLAGLHAEPIEDQNAFFYAMHRKHGELDLDRLHFGTSWNGQIGPVEWWADLGGVVGTQLGQSVAGWGVDVAACYVLEEDEWEPSVFAGFAIGSGDDDPAGGGADGNFRQTGLQDNNSRFNGLVSFRYLGELTRFELSNLIVVTAGFGFRPTPRTSVDLVFHHYRQVEAAPFLADTRLRQLPNGIDVDLGEEIDLIIGFKQLERVRIELNLCWFNPGNAFSRDDPAFFGYFSIQYNF